MQIEYIPLFKQALNKILSCGDDYYSQQQLKVIFTKIKQITNLVSDNPQLGGKEALLYKVNEEYRSIVITKQIKLIYIIINDTIYFTDIWDVRQSPKTLTNRIESLY